MGGKRLGSECTITPVCGVTCDKCPACNIKSKAMSCDVMSAAIRAFQAQEDYWALKIQHEGLGE